MTPMRLAVRLASMVFACGLAGVAALADGPGPVPPQAEEMRLTLTGTVRMPDGSPASGATVESTDDPDIESRQGSTGVARTDASGRFQLRGIFGNGAHLYARSADGNHQTTLRISSLAARSASATPVELTLALAVNHEVLIVADGRPVEGAHVVASGMEFHVQGVTGADGKLKLRLPARDRLQGVVAWHRRMGVSGVRDLDARPASDKTELTLMPTRAALDPRGQPGRPSGPGPGARHQRPHEPGLGRRRQDRSGPGAHGRRWHGDRALGPAREAGSRRPEHHQPRMEGRWDRSRTTGDPVRNRVVTIHARRKVSVEGRLVMPAGASPEGLLITGFGFGPRNRGDIPYARARADGSFTLRVASEHGYVLGLADLQWASDTWSGLILAREAWKPADIRMSAYRATPVTVRVTRGERHAPVNNAWVEVGSQGDVKWVDAGGKERTGRAAIRSWLRTDGKGLVQAGAARGQYNVRLVVGDWNEERTIVVSSDKPVEVEFPSRLAGRATGHRPIDRRRQALRTLCQARGPRLVASPSHPASHVPARGQARRHVQGRVRCGDPRAVLQRPREATERVRPARPGGVLGRREDGGHGHLQRHAAG